MRLRPSWSRLSIFWKITTLILLMLVPATILFVYSSRTSSALIQENLQRDSLEALVNHARRLDEEVDQISKFAITFLADPQAVMFPKATTLLSYSEARTLKNDLAAKLRLQLSVMDSSIHFALFAPESGETIAMNTDFSYDFDYFLKNTARNWTPQLRIDPTGDEPTPVLIRHFSLRPFIEDVSRLNLIIEAGMPFQMLENRLTKMKEVGKDPFIRLDDGTLLFNATADEDICARLVEKIDLDPLRMPQNLVVQLGRIRYQVSAVYVANIGITLIDFVPLSRILAPLVFSQRLFAAVIALLFVTGIAMAFLLYRNVQVPIRDLLHALKQIQGGHFRTRVSLTRHNEFRYLFLRFNKMAREIDRLVNTVYREQLRSQEAAFKQLQSQINPHFIYNCLFFIKNMARLGNEDAVIRMALHLGDYLRYTTRVENQVTLLRDELAHITNYLSIQKLRSERLEFTVDIPDAMLELKVPRLILQPLVENAVIHGIEPNPDSRRIRIRGFLHEGFYAIEVEDDGRSAAADIEKIRADIAAVDGAKLGCGLRNIEQRLQLFYSPPASMFVETGEWGGVTIRLIIPSPNPA